MDLQDFDECTYCNSTVTFFIIVYRLYSKLLRGVETATLLRQAQHIASRTPRLLDVGGPCLAVIVYFYFLVVVLYYTLFAPHPATLRWPALSSLKDWRGRWRGLTCDKFIHHFINSTYQLPGCGLCGAAGLLCLLSALQI